MITKATLLERARAQDLLPTTVEKDYVLGWMLAAISEHPRLSQWVFKGGTCLKKCYFETYRFSEDLDFTIPSAIELSPDGIMTDLSQAADWVSERSGISFPPEIFKVEQYTNSRGKESYQAKVGYACRLNLSRGSLQRIKFDITQDELLADTPDQRAVSHPYEDAHEPAPRVRCYSINEILAEKTRALYERQGRARDVYDLVHLSHGFRDSIEPAKAASLLKKKFEFKGLPIPTVDLILDRIQADTLRANWEHQLAHQLPKLPPVEEFLSDLSDSIAWWLSPEDAKPPLPGVEGRAGETAVPRQNFPTGFAPIPQGLGSGRITEHPTPMTGLGHLDRARYAARNRMCIEIRYSDVTRIAEPYSLRLSSRGNTLLYVFELLRGGAQSEGIKALNVEKIQSIAITDRPFKPRYLVEL